MNTYNEEEMSKTIKALREKNGHTLRELAKILDTNYTSLFKMESGEQKMNLDVLVKISKLYHVPLEELLGLSESEVHGVPIVTKPVPYAEEDLKFQTDIKYILDNYLEAKKENFSSHPIGHFIRRQFVETIENETKLNLDKYLVVGSGGMGQWATIPWVSIYDRSVTKSATKGKYLVYLFKADMSGVYLSLNQGWTYYRENYGTKEGRLKANRIAAKLQDLLHTVPVHLREKEIDLKANNDLAKGYEAGHIYGRYYDLKDLPTSEELIADLQSMLIAYQEIVTMMNGRTDEQFNDFLLLEDNENFLEDAENEEENFQESANEDGLSTVLEKEEIKIVPRPRKEPVIDSKGRKRWPRNAKEAGEALNLANYHCMVDRGHEHFISETTGRNYVEAHHLVPLSQQEHFEYDLDRVENIICLCPNCHKAIHHAQSDLKEQLIERLFKGARDDLEQAGIEVLLSDLKAMYIK